MTTIEDTIRTAVGTSVPREYQHLITQVSSVLQAREDRVIQALVRIAGQQGISQRQVMDALAQAQREADQPVGTGQRTGYVRTEAPAPRQAEGVSRDELRRAANRLQTTVQQAFAQVARDLRI